MARRAAVETGDGAAEEGGPASDGAGDHGASVHRAYPRDEIVRGRFAGGAADIFLGFAPPYRVSWQTCLGGIPADVFVDNRQNWSADHCSVDPSFVPGVLFCNRRLPGAASRRASILDVTPTILGILGIAPHGDVDGTDLRN